MRRITFVASNEQDKPLLPVHDAQGDEIELVLPEDTLTFAIPEAVLAFRYFKLIETPVDKRDV